MAKKEQDPILKKDPICLLMDDLEERTGGVFIVLEDLDKSPPASPSTSWLLARKHLLISEPVATLAFQVSPKVKKSEQCLIAGGFVILTDLIDFLLLR